MWTGSTTILLDGQIIMLYPSKTANLTDVQLQNLACPANLSDPLHMEWVKNLGIVCMVLPPGIGFKDFRELATS